jgi:transcriptional regulator with XRE-family HTH domain
VAEADKPGGPFPNQISDLLWQRRSNISALAKQTDIERSWLSRIVNGHALPGPEQLDAIVAALQVRADDLFEKTYLEAIEASRARTTAAGESVA